MYAPDINLVDTGSDEYQRNYQHFQHEVIVEDFFTFATKLGKYNYARWCAWGYEPDTWSEEKWKRISCWKKSFDCGWVIKAYGFVKWIIPKEDIWHINSTLLYDMAIPMAPQLVERWDYTSRQLVSGSWIASTHGAFVTRPLSWNVIWIFDWLGWRFKERKLIVHCNDRSCMYNTNGGHYRIKFSTNPLYELAMSWGIEVQPFQQDTWTNITGAVQPAPTCVSNPDNPLWFHITIDGYAYDSIANKAVNRWYVRNHDVDMIVTYLCEHWGFNPKVKSLTNDSWICQLHYNKTNAYWIDNPLRETLDFQMQACLDKWNLVVDKNLRACYKNRKPFLNKINFLSWGFRSISDK